MVMNISRMMSQNIEFELQLKLVSFFSRFYEYEMVKIEIQQKKTIYSKIDLYKTAKDKKERERQWKWVSKESESHCPHYHIIFFHRWLFFLKIFLFQKFFFFEKMNDFCLCVFVFC